MLETLRLYSDKKTGIHIAHNPLQHDTTKHVEFDIHFIKEKLNDGIVKSSFMKTEEQQANILTERVSW